MFKKGDVEGRQLRMGLVEGSPQTCHGQAARPARSSSQTESCLQTARRQRLSVHLLLRVSPVPRCRDPQVIRVRHPGERHLPSCPRGPPRHPGKTMRTERGGGGGSGGAGPSLRLSPCPSPAPRGPRPGPEASLLLTCRWKHDRRREARKKRRAFSKTALIWKLLLEQPCCGGKDLH